MSNNPARTAILPSFFGLIALCFFVFVPPLPATIVSFGIADPGWHVISTSPSGLELQWNAPSLEAEEVVKDGIVYWKLALEGSGVAADPGMPDLPVARVMIRLPAGGSISVVAHAANHQLIRLKTLGVDRIAPRPRRVAKIRGATPDDGWTVDEKAYTGPCGELGAAVVERLGTMRGVKLGLVEVNPISYDPLGAELRLTKSIRVKLSFDEPLRDIDQRLLSQEAWQQVSCRVLNMDQSRDPVDLPAGYLIITADALENALSPLAAWKAEKGYHVTVTNTSQIPGGATADNIRSYIQDAYDNWTVPPVFVLLVGDSNTIPAFNGTGYQNPKTDLYYGCMDGGSDYLPDLYVGRFSMRTADDVAAEVEKTVDYEQAQWSQGSTWAGRQYFISSDDWGNHGLTEGTHTYCMAKARSHGVTCDSLWGYYGTGTPIAEAVNTGRAMVAYSGHGVENMWQGPIFSNWNVSQLSNLDRYPIVLSFACLTGDFTWSSDPCFMENWVRQHDKAAVVACGSSANSFWPDDDYLQRRVWDALFDDGFNWPGGFILEGKMLYALWEPNQWMERGYFEQYNILGDPSLLLFTLEPVALAATIPASIPSGSPQTVQITVTRGGQPMEGALVGLHKEGEVQEAGYADANGQVSLQVTATTTGSIIVTSTAYNSIVYVDSITVGSGDAIAPTAPSWATLSPAGILTWGASSDNVGVAGYRIYRQTHAYFDTEGISHLRETAETTSSFPGSMGNPAVNYYFLITAFDAADNESAPSPLVGEYDFDLPSVP